MSHVRVPSAAEIVASAAAATFDKRLVTNIFRGTLVEAVVAAALPDWQWVSADYASFDFHHPDGTRLEVKQSALLQTWSKGRTSRPSWDIRERTGQYVDGGDVWQEGIGRNADIYVFALHTVTDETADHREPMQWLFWPVPTSSLPPYKRLSWSALAATKIPQCNFVELSERVDILRRARMATGTDASPLGTAAAGN